jgi:hypothetical protein
MNCRRFLFYNGSFLIFSVLAFVFLASNFCFAASLPKPLSYWKLDEVTQPYKDSSNNNQASCIEGNPDSCPESVVGFIENAQRFNGSTQGLDVPGNSFNWGSTGSFSVAFWMIRPGPLPPVGTVNNEVIVGREDRLNGKQLHWWVGMWAGVTNQEGGGARFGLIDSLGNGAGDGFLLSQKKLTDGEWHHVVAVRDGQENKNLLYVDGVLEDWVSITYAGDFVSSFANLNIGYLAGNNSSGQKTKAFYFKGTVDEVRVYNVALTEAQVEGLFRLRPNKGMPWLPIILMDDN